MTRRLHIFLFISAVFIQAVWAQDTPDSSRFKLRDGTIDLAVPESPAFSAIDLTPQQVARPTSGRELATSLLNGVDREGNFHTGIAIDTAPYMLLAGDKITLRQYQKPSQYLTRFLARMQTSLATAKGSASADKSVKIALGWRFTLMDFGDPRTDDTLLGCLEREAATVLADASPVSPMASEESIEIENRRREEAVRAAVQPCREAAAKRNWNRTAWIAGVAPTWISPDGKASQMEYGGTALWTSFGFGFEGTPVLEDHAMIAVYAKKRNNQWSADRFNSGSYITQDHLALGGRLLLGVSSTQFNVEGLYIRNNRQDNIEDRYWNLGFGFEQKLVDNIWLNLSFGRELSRRESDDSLFVLGSFNWGFGKK